MVVFPLRDSGGSGRDPVNKALLYVNFCAFLLTLPWLVEAVGQFSLVPSVVARGERPWTLFTSTFLHGGFTHLVGNMWFLWMFGDNVERGLGHRTFLVLYLVSGLVGSVAHTLADTASTIPTVGASGAISGVMGAYLLLFPRNRIDVLVFRLPIRMHAWGVFSIWLAFQAFLLVLMQAGVATGIAVLAHLGGFAAGIALAWLASAPSGPRPAGAPAPKAPPSLPAAVAAASATRGAGIADAVSLPNSGFKGASVPRSSTLGEKERRP